MNAWIMLLFAIGFEVVATTCLKLSNGFEKPLWGALSIALYCAAFGFLAPAIRSIPIGVAYAIWSGVGIVAITVIGAFAFGQKLHVFQYGFIALILFGAVGLRLTIRA